MPILLTQLLRCFCIRYFFYGKRVISEESSNDVLPALEAQREEIRDIFLGVPRVHWPCLAVRVGGPRQGPTRLVF